MREKVAASKASSTLSGQSQRGIPEEAFRKYIRVAESWSSELLTLRSSAVHHDWH
jgi:hypothetical protein